MSRGIRSPLVLTANLSLVPVIAEDADGGRAMFDNKVSTNNSLASAALVGEVSTRPAQGPPRSPLKTQCRSSRPSSRKAMNVVNQLSTEPGPLHKKEK